MRRWGRQRTAPGDPEKRRGFFEGWRDGALRGWALDPPGAGAGALLRVATGPGAAQVIVADLFRGDVRSAGFGDGLCGFALALDGTVPDRASCRWADTGEHLPGSPWRRDVVRARQCRAGTTVMLLDAPISGSRAFTGAAFDTAEPDRRLSLALIVDGEECAEARACRYAPALADSGSDGLHGFRLAVPAIRSPARRVEIRDAGNGVLLAKISRTWIRLAGLA